MPEKQEVVCGGCRKTLRIPVKYWGKKVRCPQCSEVLSIPAEPVLDAEEVLDDVELIEDDDPFATASPWADDDPYAETSPVSAPPRRRSAPKPKTKQKKSRKTSSDGGGGAFSAEKNMINSGVLGGCGMIAFGVIWFVGAWMAGWIFPYSLVLVLAGFIAIGKGLLGGE